MRRLLGRVNYLPFVEEEENFISRDSSEEDERQEKYREYLLSAYWESLREQVLARDKVCTECRSNVNLQVHHLSYRGWYKERLTDLVVLCGNCHHNTHKSS